MSKTKHNPPQKREPKFIKFSKIQQDYLSEVRNRHFKEFNAALESVYRELGITEKLQESPDGTYQLRLDDLSGLDVNPAPPKEGS